MGYDPLANCDVRCIQVDMVGNEKWSNLLKGNWKITAIGFRENHLLVLFSYPVGGFKNKNSMLPGMEILIDPDKDFTKYLTIAYYGHMFEKSVHYQRDLYSRKDSCFMGEWWDSTIGATSSS
jgi:hypothetical protein